MKSGITFTVLFVVFIGSIWFGFRLVSAPFDVSNEPPATCEQRTFEAGDTLAAHQIRISAMNASEREGLANRVIRDMETNGFAPGESANAPETEFTVSAVTILTDDPDHPAVRLVAAQFRDDVDYESPTGLATLAPEVVMVMVGPDYSGLRNNPNTTRELSDELSWCAAITNVSEAVD